MTLIEGATSPFTYNDLYSAPLGTVITYTRRDLVYFKEIDGFRQVDGSYTVEMASCTGFTVTSVPGDPFIETLEQFKWRLWTSVIGMGISNSINMDALEESLRGVDALMAPTLRPNMYVHLRHRQMVEHLPEGTILTTGDHRTPDRHAILVKRNRDIEKVMGPSGFSPSNVAQVAHYPDLTVVTGWGEPAENEADLVNEYRHNLWTLGLQFKSRFSWCGAAEQTMGLVYVGPGIPATLNPPDSATEPAVPVMGSTVTIDDARRAPVGSQFRNRRQSSGAVWTQMSVDDWRTRDAGATQGQAVRFNLGLKEWVRWGPEVTEATVPAPGDSVTREQMLAAPLGSQFQQGPNTRWIKDGDDHWMPVAGSQGLTGPSSEFYLGSLRWVIWGPVGHQYGDVLIQTQREALPLGTLVGYRSPSEDGADWNYCIRSDRGSFDTAYICGPNTGMHIGSARCRYLAAPGETLPVESVAQLAQMPVGTTIKAGTGGIYRIKRDIGLWQEIGGSDHGRTMTIDGLLIPNDPVAEFIYIPVREGRISTDYQSWGEALVTVNITTREDFDRLPVGTQIASIADRRLGICFKHTDGWRTASGEPLTPHGHVGFSVTYPV